MKTSDETRYTLRVKDEKGEAEDIQVVEKKAQELIEEAKKNSKPEPEVVKMQTFRQYEAESPADFAELVPNEQERVNIFNRGYVLKGQAVMRENMLDPEWAAVEGIYDLRSDCAEVRERRKATPAEKALRQLAALSADDLAKVLQQFGLAGAATPAA